MFKVAQEAAPLPKWLHVRIDPRVPEEWHFIAALFVAAALQVLADVTPVRAVLRLRMCSGNLDLRFLVDSSLPADKAAALKNLTALVSRLGNALRAERQHADEQSGAFTLVDLSGEQAKKPESSFSGSRGRENAADGGVEVLTWDERAMVGAAERGRDGEGAARIVKMLKRLSASGGLRPLCVPDTTWPQMADTLAQDFPNFAAVVKSVIRPHVALCARGIRHRLPPLLLVGPPGIGKTHFAEALTRLLNVPSPLVVSIAGETNGSAIGGSSTFWSNSSPGRVFEFLAWGGHGAPAVANGLVVLDEIDKVATDPRYDPLGALYTLLEEDTARMFRDQSLPDVIMNASYLRVVATANELESIPLPLRSRMVVFHIEPPSPEQARRIVESIFRSLARQMGVPDVELPPAVIEQAVRVEPRRAKLLLQGALATALASDRPGVEISDWEAVQPAGTTVRRRTIGFVSHV